MFFSSVIRFPGSSETPLIHIVVQFPRQTKTSWQRREADLTSHEKNEAANLWKRAQHKHIVFRFAESNNLMIRRLRYVASFFLAPLQFNTRLRDRYVESSMRAWKILSKTDFGDLSCTIHSLWTFNDTQLWFIFYLQQFTHSRRTFKR